MIGNILEVPVSKKSCRDRCCDDGSVFCRKKPLRTDGTSLPHFKGAKYRGGGSIQSLQLLLQNPRGENLGIIVNRWVYFGRLLELLYKQKLSLQNVVSRSTNYLSTVTTKMKILMTFLSSRRIMSRRAHHLPPRVLTYKNVHITTATEVRRKQYLVTKFRLDCPSSVTCVDEVSTVQHRLTLQNFGERKS